MASERYVLKILSGPHHGAEIGLNIGDYVFGSRDDADIILNDLTIAERHARLIVEQDLISVEPVEGEVIMSKDSVAERRQVEFGQSVALGTTNFAVLREGQRMTIDELIASPNRDALSGENTDAGVGTNADADGGNPPARGTVSRLLYPAGGVSLMVGGMLLIFLQGSPTTSASVSDTAKAKLESTIAREGLSHLNVTRNGAGLLQIEGHIESPNKKRLLEAALARSGLDVKMRAFVDQEIITAAEQIIEALGFQKLLKVADVERGKVILKGYAENAADWKPLLETLRRDIPGIRAIDDQAVDTQGRRLDALRAAMAEYKLLDKLDITTGPGRIGIGGALSQGDYKQYRTALRAFMDKHGGTPAITSTVKALSEALPELNIRGVKLGAMPYVIGADGSRYMRGAKLADGFTLEEIHSDRLILSDGKRRYTYPVENKDVTDS